MSLILAIPCKDSIVIAADGRSTDFDTGEARPTVNKIFKLTSNSAVLIAGNGLIDELDKYMGDLVRSVRAKGNTNIVDIARDLKEIIDMRDWAEWKDKLQNSHLEALAVGYDGIEPRIFAIRDNREFIKVYYCVMGGWGGRC